MAEFRYYTRGKSSPRGKSRVFFTAHPKDYRFLDEIREDILVRQNCVIFYLEPDVRVDEVEDYEAHLSQMQLFVVPITNRLLSTSNRALDIDIPFALAHHIPVLPLMQENDLDELFNQKVGDLQYLDKYNTDPTAIGYDEKLTKYLDSVIVGDELAEKIRAAFDAYIFLSYRKKDRKYAQELMNLIHQNPLCRDIAIWYDEFLTPGENFNDAIEAALKKCDLFTLAVTPNIVNEENYILTTEYPMACQLGKNQLHVEMLATDRDKIRKRDLPEPVSPSGITDHLKRFALEMAIRADDRDPIHNFFIGLAYLSGIDVEVDHTRAVELITGAADSGFPEAIEKLVSMYETGDGVKRDYQKAIEWQVRLVDLLREENEISPSEKVADNLIRALIKLGTEYMSFRSRAEQISPVQEAAQLAGKAWEKYQQNHFLLDCAKCLRMLADILVLQHEEDEREDFYHQAMSAADQIIEQTHDSKLRNDAKRIKAYCYDGLGDISARRHLYKPVPKEIEDYYQQAKDIREQLYHENHSQDNARALVASYRNTAQIAMGKLGLDEKVKNHGGLDPHSFSALLDQESVHNMTQAYLQALVLQKDIAQETNSVSDREVLADLYFRIGSTAEYADCLSDAVKNYLEGIELLNQIHLETDDPGDTYYLSKKYESLGNMLARYKEFQKAEKYFKKGIELLEGIELQPIKHRDSELVIYSDIKLGILYFQLANIYRQTHSCEREKECLQKARLVFERVYDKPAVVLARLDIIAKRLGELEKE